MYHVDMSVELKKKLKTAYHKAAHQNRGDAFLAALKQINHRLATDPDVFGEPKYNFQQLRLQIRNAAVLPIFVEFSVSMEHRVVFIRSILLMSDPNHGTSYMNGQHD
jgi:hypothetical protein